MTNIARMLISAKRALLTSAYQRHYCAMNADGKSCSPHSPGAALSYRGALIVGSGGGRRGFELDAWMMYHNLLPRGEPKTRHAAIELIDRALAMIGESDEQAA